MAEAPKPSSAEPAATPLSPTAKILRCFSGSFVAGSLAILLYRLMTAIATTFAQKPIVSDNVATMNIASAVRTLVVGMVALGAGVFGMAALGLFLLGIQLTVQRVLGRSQSPSES